MLTGRVMLVVLAACLVLCEASTPGPLATEAAGAATAMCERAPAHAQPADAHYRLGVAGEPDLFLPGELYTVTLQGVDSGQGPTPFIGFKIWVEISNDVDKAEDNDTSKPTSRSKVQSLGSFQAYDAQTKLEEHCTPAVDNATAHPKTEIQVIWSAPSDMFEACVRLCGRAEPAKGSGSSNGSGSGTTSVLARKICAAPAAPATFTRQPPIIEPCCACDEAKYEVTFEGLWTRNTHPRDFPPEGARAHFGDVIGASHTAQYRVWQEGRVASTGLRRLADDGTTTALEKELKAESDHIRTIIKARGISWQQVAGAGTPNTFAVFRVDAKNHLVSLAAKLAPSPDWIVGVSALELCNVNCTWRISATLPLYPYDAGTDSGIAYTSHRVPTVPAAPVRALRPDWPRDVRSPFFSTSGEMRPFARLRLTRLRLYEKNCDGFESVGSDRAQAPPEGMMSRGGGGSGSGAGAGVGGGGVSGVAVGGGGGSGAGGACSTRVWGAWGACSVTCGPGRAARQRAYVWPARAYAEACRTPLTDYRTCNGPRMHCRAPSEYEPDPAEATGPCAVSAWSAWSPCEGCGVRARTRHYLVPRAHKRCHRGFRASTVLSQAMPCDTGPCVRPPGIFANSTNFDWFFVDNPRGECPVTSWSGWSPCSARCGRGRRLRTRLYLATGNAGAEVQRVLTKRLVHRWTTRFALLQQLETHPENITDEDPAVESLVQEHLERCQFTLTQQEALCDGEEGSCLNATVSPVTCKLPISVGHCRGYEERWFHDASRGVCEPFGFSGCGGNANNFRTREHCMQACGPTQQAIVTVATTVPTETSSKKIKPTPPHENNEVMQNDAPSGPSENIDCETGPWLGWTDCFGDCRFAVKLNYRLVLRATTGAGKPCRKLVKSRLCTPAHCHQGGTSGTTEFYHNLFYSSYDDEE